jgi:hypothetical protein
MKLPLIAWLLGPAVALIACNTTSSGTPKPTTSPYNFVGVTAHPAGVEGVRATITWTVIPKTLPKSAQSTWIGIFGKANQTTKLSYEIAQIGWKQSGQDTPRVFWEWGTDQSHNEIGYGSGVASGQALTVELDRTPAGGYTFLANNVAVASVSLTWAPDFVSADAETHDPGDYLAGSSVAPEIVSALEIKIDGKWQLLSGKLHSTSSSYLTTTDPAGNLLIWDSRL